MIMIWYLSIALIAASAALAIWSSRLMALRRGEALAQHNFYVRRVLKVSLIHIYEEHLRDWVKGAIYHARTFAFTVLKWVYVKLKNSTGSLERRFITLMNMVRGRGVENISVAPSKFIGELKNHKNSLEFPRPRV